MRHGWLMFLPFLPECLAFHAGAMPGEPDNATFAPVEGARVRYVDVGKGPVVVLAHGFASSLDVWAGLIPELSKAHRVLALDLKGFGWTDRPEGDYSPAAQAKLILALMEQRGIEKADVVAHSWGASVALATALAAPARVNRVVLYDAWVYEEQIPAFFYLSRSTPVGETLFALYYGERPDERMALGFYDRRYVTEQLVEDVEKALQRPGTTAAALATVRGQRFIEMQSRYREVKKPTLLLWGREDRVSPVSIGERLVRDLPDAELKVYPRCGHFPMIEAASESNRDLLAFLEPRR